MQSNLLVRLPSTLRLCEKSHGLHWVGQWAAEPEMDAFFGRTARCNLTT